MGTPKTQSPTRVSTDGYTITHATTGEDSKSLGSHDARQLKGAIRERLLADGAALWLKRCIKDKSPEAAVDAVAKVWAQWTEGNWPAEFATTARRGAIPVDAKAFAGIYIKRDGMAPAEALTKARDFLSTREAQEGWSDAIKQIRKGAQYAAGLAAYTAAVESADAAPEVDLFATL